MRPAYFSIAAAVSTAAALLLSVFNVIPDLAAIQMLLGSIVLSILGLRE